MMRHSIWSNSTRNIATRDWLLLRSTLKSLSSREACNAGAPSDMWEKVPQAVNLNTWPATIFVGRDGLVKGIHSGFASPASGEFNHQLQKEFTAKIEKLLAEKATRDASVASNNKPGPG